MTYIFIYDFSKRQCTNSNPFEEPNDAAAIRRAYDMVGPDDKIVVVETTYPPYTPYYVGSGNLRLVGIVERKACPECRGTGIAPVLSHG